ncbi:hypothetical protein [Streptomyces scabiei]|uniref:hypothetical protein n=1 Tax=Streptomyces scabiei TaxID=1930 RepID=UPI0029AD78B2|nr:hypothetical protein [Streptomyces scabiei]MDX3520722.1 hypothetical protein [Streptomyces scabiei]
MAAVINSNLTPTTYGQIKPGDRVILWPVHPTRPDAHLHARTVAEIIRTRRDDGLTPNWATPNGLLIDYHPGGYLPRDPVIVEWRDASGSLFINPADETVYITTAA